MAILNKIGKTIRTIKVGRTIRDKLIGTTAGPRDQFSIDSFKSKLDENNGLLPANRFLLTLSFPIATTRVGDELFAFANQKHIQFLCHATSLPGLSFTTSEVRRHGVGPLTFYPSNVTYPELPLTFFIDGNGLMMKFIHAWFSKVVHMGVDTKSEKVNNESDKAKPYELYYKDEYKCEATLTVYNTKNQEIIEYTFNDLIPASIGDTQMDWSSEAPMDFSSTFRYTSFSIKNIHDEVTTTESRGISLFEKISKTVSVAQSINGTIRKPEHVGDLLAIANNARTIQRNFNFIVGG